MTTFNVPSLATPTIASAITAASSGDTIIVASGTYNEKIFINKSLTLLGAQANVDARTRTAVPESIITFALSIPTDFGSGIVNFLAPDIIFNGFTVQ